MNLSVHICSGLRFFRAGESAAKGPDGCGVLCGECALEGVAEDRYTTDFEQRQRCLIHFFRGVHSEALRGTIGRIVQFFYGKAVRGTDGVLA